MAATVLFTACGTKHEIRVSAKGYLNAMGNYRVADAEPYATQNTRKNSLPMLSMLVSRCDTAYINSNTPAKITIKGVRMLSDTSAYAYYHKRTPITEQEDSLLMLREDGRWLAEVRLGPIPGIVFLDSASTHPRIPLPRKE